MNASELIQRLGGPTKAGELCEVSAQAVIQWRDNGVPKHQLKFLRLKRPELFEGLPTDARIGYPDTESQPH